MKKKIKSVKAAVLVEEGKLEIREFPYPENIENGAMIVKPLMVGICGTDKHAYQGKSL